MLTRGVAALLLVVSLSACGGKDGSSPATPESGTTIATPGKTPSGGPKLPECESIWKDGATLPADYAGCATGGQTRLEQTTTCKDKTRLIVHDEQYYAVTGQKIEMPAAAPLEDSAAFGKLFTTCTGK